MDAARGRRSPPVRCRVTSQTGPVHSSSNPTWKASCPAGTGVWVVNTLVARTWRSASANDAPPATNSRSRSTIMNAACPSLACQTAGRDAHGAEHPHAADAEDPLLPQAELGAAGVELVHEPAVLGVVGLEVGIEQIDRHPADPDPPGAHVHRPAGGVHHGHERLAVPSLHRLQRGPRDLVLLVAVLLPAVEPEALVEVPLHVEQAHAHQRHTEVGGCLAVVAGEHAEAAGVDRHRGVQSELRAEVGDGAPVQLGIACG